MKAKAYLIILAVFTLYLAIAEGKADRYHSNTKLTTSSVNATGNQTWYQEPNYGKLGNYLYTLNVSVGNPAKSSLFLIDIFSSTSFVFTTEGIG
jgi:hypothetical protein